MIHSEHQEQSALFSWARLQEKKIPELKMLVAIPNGGHRHKAVAAKLKAEGVKAGYPDVQLDVARGGYHGLKIEMKRPKDSNHDKGRVTKKQLEWLYALETQGYMVVVCWGWESARDTLVGYLCAKLE